MPGYLRSRSLRWLVPLSLALFNPACAEEQDGVAGGGGEGGTGGSFLKGGGGTGGEGATGGTGGTPDGGGGADGGGGSTVNLMTTGGAPAGGGGAGGGEGGEGGEGGGNGLDLDDFPLETEMNGTLASSNDLPDDALGFQAEIDSANDIDIFNVFVSEGSSLSAEITDGMGGCPPGANVRISVYDPSSNEIAARTALCPRLDGNVDPDLLEVDEEGLYFIQVSASAPLPFYVIEITATPPVCGDNVINQGEECDDGNVVNGDGCEDDCTETPVCGDGDVQTGETCDDGNLGSGDGCSSTCALEGPYCPEAEPNNTTTTATVITTCDGGFGVIDPIGDQDYYRVTVTVPGSGIRARTTGINGTGCPTIGTTAFNSLLRLEDANGSSLGSNDSGGTGITPCSLIDPAKDAFAANLAPGNYYIAVVESGSDAVSPQYAVLIDVIPPGCGDGVVQVGEECDDANLADNDGCDSLCQLEGNYCAEVEANNTTATATPLVGCDGAAGAITPVGDKDVFRVDVTVAGSSITASTVNITGTGCPTGADTFLRLLNSDGTERGNDDDEGDGNCSLITPANDLFARSLPVGTYYLQVEEYLNDSTVPPYLLKVRVAPPGCGDTIVQAGEQCDDGNLIDGDGCTATCQVEGNFCFESEPNDSYTQATSLTACDGGAGQIDYVGDADWFYVDVTEDGSSLRLEVVDTTGAGCPAAFDSFVRLYARPATQLVQLGTDNDDGNASCSLVDPIADAFATNLPIGRYYLRVEENGNDATSAPYLVLAELSPPACGDGLKQTGEECDDGNVVDGDGCDDICEVESTYCGEEEPNGTTATATDLAGCEGAYGRVSPVADVDYFRFEVTVAGSSVRAETTNLLGTGCPAGTDTLIRLYNAAGTELGNDDQDGIDSCSLVNPATDGFARDLPVGTYYVRVEESGNNAVTPDWLLHIDITPPSCGDGIAQSTEQCDDGNVVDGDGCSATCQLLACGAGQTPVTLTATGLPLTIPDGSATGVSSTISQPTVGTVTQVAVRLTVLHAYDADVDLTLRAPNNVVFDLSSDNGADLDNYVSTVFSSTATTVITSGTPPFTGVFAAEQSLAALVGTPANGNWVLTAYDDDAIIAGTLNAYALYMCVQP